MNAGVHVFGLALALLGGIWLLTQAQPGLERRIVLGFTAAWLFLYTASILYHSSPNGTARQLFLAFDHGAIFLLIAASYMPLALLPHLPGGTAPLLWLLWAPAAAGLFGELVAFAAGYRAAFERWSLILYLAQGWLPVALYGRAVLDQASWPLMFCMLGSGLVYSVGVAFYRRSGTRWNHAIWHASIVLGSLINFGGVSALLRL